MYITSAHSATGGRTHLPFFSHGFRREGGYIFLHSEKKKQREDNSKGFCLPKVNKRLVYLCCQINKSRYIKFISTSMYCIERDRHCITKHSRKLVRNSFFLCVRKFCTSKKGKATDFLRRFRICTTKNTFVENRE